MALWTASRRLDAGNAFFALSSAARFHAAAEIALTSLLAIIQRRTAVAMASK
jgi:hypothetical protein